jgi:hypothetical protein
LHRLPRVPYQTTPFTIDPSARSTQTFAERYGVSPPHSNENLYGNDYTIGTRGDVRDEKQAKSRKVDLVETPTMSNVVPTNNNNGSGEGENCPQALKSTVIKGLKNAPNNTHSSFDVEQRLQVSSFSIPHAKCALIILPHIHRHHPCQKQFLDSFMRNGKRGFFCSTRMWKIFLVSSTKKL